MLHFLARSFGASFVILGLSLLLMISLLLSSMSSPTQDALCKVPEWDFGAVSGPTELSHVFELLNTSRRRLGPLVVVTGCSSCSSASIDRNYLEPGEKGKVAVRVSLKDVRGRIFRTFLVRDEDKSPDKQIYASLVVKANRMDFVDGTELDPSVIRDLPVASGASK